MGRFRLPRSNHEAGTMPAFPLSIIHLAVAGTTGTISHEGIRHDQIVKAGTI
jgi:hypothetical protein